MTEKLTLLESNQAKQNSLEDKFSDQISSLKNELDLNIEELSTQDIKNQMAFRYLSDELKSLNKSVELKFDGLDSKVDKNKNNATKQSSSIKDDVSIIYYQLDKKIKLTQIGFIFLFIIVLVIAVFTFNPFGLFLK